MVIKVSFQTIGCFICSKKVSYIYIFGEGIELIITDKNS